MARYFFHIMNGMAEIDETGTEYDSIERVRLEAVRASGSMLSRGDQTWFGDAWQMIVADEAGKIVFSTRFSTDNHDR